jgi:DnaJ family protein C protein 9
MPGRKKELPVPTSSDDEWASASEAEESKEIPDCGDAAEAAAAPATPDLYALLEVTRDAPREVISKAYRKKALQYHPDRNPEGAEVFKQLAIAYEILSDPERRAAYDATGSTAEEGAVTTASEEIERAVRTFIAAYRGSEDEAVDLAAAFAAHEGNLPKMLLHGDVTFVNDEGELDRIVAVVDALLAAGRLDSSAGPKWAATSRGPKYALFQQRMVRERAEAEKALAAELRRRGSAAAKAPLGMLENGGDGRRRARSGGDVPAAGGSGTLLSLAAAINRNQARDSFFNMTDALEAKYCKKKRK